jgi:hypothetical protein
MRTYGRVVPDVRYPKRLKWIIIETDSKGSNDYVYVTSLIQVLKLNLGESPFYANWGIPARGSVHSQIPPDYFVARVAQQFAGKFGSLIITPTPTPGNPQVPIYSVNIITHLGTKIQFDVGT